MTTTEQQLRSALDYLLGAYHCTHDTKGTSAEIVARIDAVTLDQVRGAGAHMLEGPRARATIGFSAIRAA